MYNLDKIYQKTNILLNMSLSTHQITRNGNIKNIYLIRKLFRFLI